MSGNWDDSDDEWDKEDDELEARLGLAKISQPQQPTSLNNNNNINDDEDEEDLTLVERERAEQTNNAVLKTKGKALAAKKKAEQDAKDEEEAARKAMELEAEMEANMTLDERRALEKKRIEDADHALTDDLFGAVDAVGGRNKAAGAMEAGDVVKLKDLKDHLKHAKKVAQCLKGHGKIQFAKTFFTECLNESKDVLDDDAITEIIKICNVIKNEKVAASKRKVKGQAQKSKKTDKEAEAKAKKLAVELYGDNDKFDQYDEYGAQYEDDFF